MRSRSNWSESTRRRTPGKGVNTVDKLLPAMRLWCGMSCACNGNISIPAMTTSLATALLGKYACALVCACTCVCLYLCACVHVRVWKHTASSDMMVLRLMRSLTSSMPSTKPLKLWAAHTHKRHVLGNRKRKGKKKKKKKELSRIRTRYKHKQRKKEENKNKNGI